MVDMETLVSLAKRRGFIFQSSEIYGGLASTYDYGPLGVELKRNIKDSWWKNFVHQRSDIVGLDSSILMDSKVWVASGHTAGFVDPLVECKVCHHRFRADHIESSSCPNCEGQLTNPRMFNLMFKTFLGPVEDNAALTYLRPETAQGIFVNFQNVLNATRRKLPFGIAQIGKAFRNEITVGNFIFRTREFEQMEIEYFVKPGTDDKWHEHWVEDCLNWYIDLGVAEDRLRVRPHGPNELSHYSKATSDIEYSFPWGWGEIQGISNRTDFDLKAHSQHSGVRLDYFDEETQQHIVPYVIEPSTGVDRVLLTLIIEAYCEERVPTTNGKIDKRVLLKLHPSIAPIKVAVLPLSRNDKLTPIAKQVYEIVKKQFVCEYDDTQSIGRRYRRQDEIGTPICVTIDFQTAEDDNAVTIRSRDSMEQIRVPIARLISAITDLLAL
jgi:glycyl-tRNA synthetase